MDSATVKVLEEMSCCSHPKYADFARSVLARPGSIAESEVQLVVDGYLNDPYLTR